MGVLSGALSRMSLAREILHVMNIKAREGHLPFMRQCTEMLRLKISRQQSFRFYLMARMWRKDMPWQDKVDHLTYADYQHVVNTLNPSHRRLQYRNKFFQKQQLQAAGVATAVCFGIFHPEHGATSAGKPLRTLTDLDALLRVHVGERLVFKRLMGSGGDGFISGVIEQIGNAVVIRHPLNGFVSSLDEFFQRLLYSDEGYIVEAHVVQHEMLAQLNPDSLNTLRIWVAREAQALRVLGGFLRVGRKNVMVDNTSAGGLICTLNPEDGEMRELSTGDLARHYLLCHPDTGINHSGIKVPYYEEANDLAMKALAAFPDMGLAGLDIAIAPDGPIVIEINVDNPAQIGSACFDIPGRRLFPRLFNQTSQLTPSKATI